MPVLFIIAIVVVLVGVFFAATGRGGEMAYEPADHAPLDLGPVSAADIALLRPPTAMWGYNMQVTDEALDHIARAMRERDVRIAALEQQLAEHDRSALRAEIRGSHARPDPEIPQDEDVSPFPAAYEIPPGTGAPGPPRPPFVSPTVWAPQTNLILKASPTAKVPTMPDAPEATQPSEILEPPASVPPSEEAHETTQPSEIQPSEIQPSEVRASEVRAPHDATEPAEAQPDDHEVTQPSQTLGPQGSYDTHGWWAEQEEAEREEAQDVTGHDPGETASDAGPAGSGAARGEERDPGRHRGGREEAGPSHARPADPPDDDALAAAEEQAW